MGTPFTNGVSVHKASFINYTIFLTLI